MTTRQTARRNVLLTLALSGLAFAAAGCGTMWQEARFKRDLEVAIRLPAGAGVDVRTSNGKISIIETDRDDVRVLARIRATSQERADAVQIAGDVSGEWLVITPVWPDARLSNEGVTFEIEAPGGRPVRADGSNGSITITGFADGVVAETSNGPITVSGHRGAVRANTSNGGITVTGATEAVAADTSNGPVRIELADGGSGPVDVDTSNGSAVLVVGPGFAGQITADTSNGVVHWAGARVVSADGSKTHKTIQVGDGDQASRVDTSNGSVTVEVRD